MKAYQTVLYPKPPFNFKHSLRFLRSFRADGVARVVTDKSLSFALLISGRPVAAEVSLVGTAKKPKLECVLRAEHLDEASVSQMLEQINFYLSLQDDLKPFYKVAKTDDAFKPILKRLYGYHQVKYPSVFCCACWALVTQRTPNSFAFKTMQKLTEHLGDSITLDDKALTTFPSPQAFLSKDARAAILEATNNTRKTDRLIPIAEAFARVDAAWLKGASYDELASWLKGIHGLGQWSVDYILHRGLGLMERSPWTDTQIMRVISDRYTKGLSISKGDAKRLAETYGWYQGYWVLYLKTTFA